MPAIDFILRANSAAFTRGLASADNSIKGLKKSLQSFDVGNGLKQALGVGGVIAGFRMAITHAQELRNEAQKLGRPMDEATRSVAAYGDALDKAARGAKDLSVTVLSFVTRAGEGLGMLINDLRGVSIEQEKIREAAARGAEEQEAARDALRAKNADPERGKQLDQQLKQQREQNASIGMTDEEKRNKLIEKRTALLAQIGTMQDGNIKKEKEVEAEQIAGEIKSLDVTLGKKAEQDQERRNKEGQRELELAQEADEKAAREEQEKRQKIVEKFAPSVEELAKLEVGGFANADDPRLKARQVVQAEERAQMLFGRGDLKGGLAAATKAQEMRDSIAGMTGQGGMLTKQDAQDAFTTALAATNTELAGIKEAVSGIIKAQK